jgi:gas vesicle protein
MRNFKGPIAGFLIGGAIGGVIALLYAPKPGREIRNYISKKTNDFINDGKKATEDLWSGAKSQANEMLDNANNLLNTGNEKLALQADKIKEAIKAGVESFAENKDRDTASDSNRTAGSPKNSSSTEKAGSSRSRGKIN